MRRRWVVAGLTALVVVLGVGGELFARYDLGLGDPPLTIRDSEIDYLFKPGTYHRFGNTITYNRFSMRSDEVTPAKEDPDELRVLVFGDSVVNGGALTDDNDLATRLAQHALGDRLQRPVWIGNISAGSWGPGNHLAYMNRFGFFDAEIVIFLLSSHDIAGIPDFRPDLGPDFPLETPLLALQEAVVRYLPRYLPSRAGADIPLADQLIHSPIDEGRELFRQALRAARSSLADVVVLHHLERAEVTGEPAELADIMARWARLLEADSIGEGVPFVALAPYVDAHRGNLDHFRDAIHINVIGQRLYANALICVVERAQGLKGETCA